MEKNIKDKVMEEVKRRGLVTEQKKDTNKFDEMVSKLFHSRTQAHVLGNPPNMNRLMEIVEKYNLILLEDCCDALGSTYEGKPLGSFGKMASCSFSFKVSFSMNSFNSLRY